MEALYLVAGRPKLQGINHVGIVYGGYPPKAAGQADGGADFVRSLAHGLAERGFHVSVITSGPPQHLESEATVSTISVHRVIDDWSWWGAVRGELRRTLSVLREERVDLIHVIYPDPYLRYGSDSYHLPSLLKLASRRPLVVTFFGFGISQSKLATKIALFLLFLLSERIVITEPSLADTFRRRLPWWRSKVTEGSIGPISRKPMETWTTSELASHRQHLGLDIDSRYISFFGFWTPDKGIEALLAAARILRGDGFSLRLLLIGGRPVQFSTPYERAVLKEISSPDLRELVILTGPLSQDDVLSYLLASDLCVLPFRANPIGRSSLALALTLGVPTITSRPKSGAHLLSGLPLLSEVSAAEIVRQAEPLLNNEAVQSAAGRYALLAAAHWSWDKVLGQYVEIYRELSRRG